MTGAATIRPRHYANIGHLAVGVDADLLVDDAGDHAALMVAAAGNEFVFEGTAIDGSSEERPLPVVGRGRDQDGEQGRHMSDPNVHRELEDAYRHAGRLRAELEAAEGLRRELRSVLRLRRASDADIVRRVRSLAGEAKLLEETPHG